MCSLPARRPPGAGLLFALLIAAASLAPVEAQTAPASGRLVGGPAAPLDEVSFAPPDNAALARRHADRPRRFAEPLAAHVTPATRGTWATTPDGTRVWRAVVSSPGALSLSFGFTAFRLPEGAALWVYAEGERPEYRPFTSADNEAHGELWSPIVPGDRAVVELDLPPGSGAYELALGQVNHAFLPVLLSAREKAEAQLSGSCNVDVVCPEGDGYRDVIRSVGAYTVAGVDFCSGAAVNTTAGDGRALFLTADHCDVTPENQAQVVVYWNYQNSTCRAPGSPESGDDGDGSRSQFNTGTVELADGSDSDWSVLEFDDPILPAASVFLAGWDRRDLAPASAVAIHHPSVEEKRISFEDDATTITEYLSDTPSPAAGYIRVDDWDLGTTEGGSSGSPLFNADKRIVGQLRGGDAACGNDEPDWYGRLHRSMDDGLAAILDPTGTGLQTLDGIEAIYLAPPAVAVAPAGLDVALAPGAAGLEALTISNVAGPESLFLNWTLAVVQDPGLVGEAVRAGGPDAYGYTYRDSDEPGGPAVDFQDVSAFGTPVDFSSDDDGSAVVALPFPFPFYGATYTSVGVSTNGYAAFDYASEYENAEIPAAAAPNGLLAPLWADLHRRSGTAYTATLPDGQFVIQWTNWGRYSPASGEDLTFQILLSPDGTVEYQYGTLTTAAPNSATVGIENGDGTVGLSVAFDEPYLSSDRAVRFTAPTLWLSAALAGGSVAPGGAATVDLAFDAAGLDERTYTAAVVVSSNDPGAPSVTVPVRLVVGGTSTSLVVDGGRGVRYLGPPAEGVTVDDLAAQNLVRGVPGYFPGAPVTLWTRFDPVAKDWVPAAGAGEALELGRAFRWYLLDRDGVGDPGVSVSRALPFTLSTGLAANTDDVVVELDTDGNRFNVLANPFGRGLDVAGAAAWPGADGIRSAIYVYDEPTASWEPATGPVGPWGAFRFRAAPRRLDGTPRTLTIPATAAVAPAALSAPAARLSGPGVEAPRLAFRLEGRGLDGRPLGDRMLTVAFADSASAAFSADEDVEKFQPPATAYALLGARVGAEVLGHDARPWAPAEIALGLEARGAAPAFTLTWDATALPDGLPVTLVDLRTGAEVDIRHASSYAFKAPSRPALDAVPLRDLADGDAAADRFVLRIGDGLAAAEAAVTELGLEAPRPNPTAGAARVGFAVPEAGPVRLAVYDVRGREVAVLADGRVEAGRHEVGLDASGLAAGVYVVRLEAAGQVLTRQATVIR